MGRDRSIICYSGLIKLTIDAYYKHQFFLFKHFFNL